MVAPSSSTGGKVGGNVPAPRPTQLVSTTVNAPDPFALLDSLAAQRAASSSNAAAASSPFDPVDFLNQHYRSEALLTAQLPRLRDAVSQRMENLDEQIAQTLIRQSETASSTRQHIQEATAAIQTLEQKIRLVQQKAAQSETAVLTITADMKVLDHVKTHLQRCITTLKRLHMLVHATEELRQTSLVANESFCDYAKASQLVQAIKLLLAHFAAAPQARVLPLRQLATLVTTLQGGMYTSLKHGFRAVAFGTEKTILLETKGHPSTPKASPKKIKPSEDDEDEDEEEEKETGKCCEGSFL